MSEELAQAWNQIAGALNTSDLSAERVRYAATIKPVLQLPPEAHILEVGCGAGRILRAFHALGYQNLTGLEISQERLFEVSRLGPTSAKLVCSDGIPFEDNMFDAVVTAAVIEHVVDPCSWLQELARITRPGGMISITTDTYMWKWLKTLGLYHSIQPIDEAIWPWKILKWAQQAGLELTHCGGLINAPYQDWYFLKQVLSLVPRTNRLRAWLDRIPTPPIPMDETEAILESIQNFRVVRGIHLLPCIWSFECYYWFRKR